VVLALNGKPMENGRQLDVNLYRQPIGSGCGSTCCAPTGASASRSRWSSAARRAGSRLAGQPAGERRPQLGILGLELDDRTRAALPFLRHDQGVVVAVRSTEAMYRDDAFAAGDVIYAINRVRVANLKELRALLRDKPSGAPLAVLIERDGQLMFLPFEIN